MKILYVTGMSIPIRNVLTGKTEKEITGLPAFFYPWHKLVQKGHEVDFVMISNFNGAYNIKVDWFKKENIIANIYAPYSEYKFLRIFRQVRRFLQLIYHTHRATKNKKYDFIYCKVYEGVAGQIIAKLKGIPSGVRLFGDFTFCYPDIVKYGSFKAALKHPLEYLSFKLGSDFLLATDDGNHCDRLFEMWKPANNPCPLYFWKTGIDMTPMDVNKKNQSIPDHNYLFYAARFDHSKRHERVVKVLYELHQRNIEMHLYFAGSKTSKEYFDYVMSIVDELGLKEYVHYLGQVEKETLRDWMYCASANLFMYDFSNLGNVFYETFASGSMVVSVKDGSVSDFIVDGENGFVIDDEKHAASVIQNLLNDKELQAMIRLSARETAEQEFLSIDERFDKEVELIESTIRESRVHCNQCTPVRKV